MLNDKILKKFTAAFSIPIQIYENETLLSTYGDHIFSPNPVYYLMHPYFHQEYKVCFMITPDYLLCGYIECSGTDKFLIIGPVSPFELSARHAESLLTTMNLPLSQKDALLRWFRYLPQMNLPNFRSMLDFLNQLINEDYSEAPIHVTYQVKHIELNGSKDAFPNIHTTRLVEDMMCAIVRSGKVEEVAQFFDSLFNRPELLLTNLGHNAIRSLKNTFIASTAITTRTAIQGGVDFDTAISLSDYYIVQMEKLQLFGDVNALLRTMFLDFTKRVALCSRPESDSATVNAIYRDVQTHLYEKISSQDIARHLSMERTYLCHHFKEKTGMTITDYVQKQKINEAKYLLESSDLPLAMISEKLEFSSQQHFQAIFKKITGTTPGKYRLHTI